MRQITIPVILEQSFEDAKIFAGDECCQLILEDFTQDNAVLLKEIEKLRALLLKQIIKKHRQKLITPKTLDLFVEYPIKDYKATFAINGISPDSVFWQSIQHVSGEPTEKIENAVDMIVYKHLFEVFKHVNACTMIPDKFNADSLFAKTIKMLKILQSSENISRSIKRVQYIGCSLVTPGAREFLLTYIRIHEFQYDAHFQKKQDYAKRLCLVGMFLNKGEKYFWDFLNLTNLQDEFIFNDEVFLKKINENHVFFETLFYRMSKVLFSLPDFKNEKFDACLSRAPSMKNTVLQEYEMYYEQYHHAAKVLSQSDLSLEHKAMLLDTTLLNLANQNPTAFEQCLSQDQGSALVKVMEQRGNITSEKIEALITHVLAQYDNNVAQELPGAGIRP